MNRLQKKCTIASAGVHLLLAGILVIGPGFLTRKNKLDDMATLDWIPPNLVDAAISGGGNPAAKPPPLAVPAPQPPIPQPVAQPPPPQPQPQPEKKAEPEPPKELPKPIKPVEQADTPEPVRKRHLPNVPTTPVKAKPNPNKVAESQAKADAAAAQQLANKKRLAEMIRNTATGLKADASPATVIETSPGTGGGEAYPNYAQVVKSVYEHAWIAPDEAANDDAVTKVTITIASDGSVISGRILNASGDASVDRSVQRTLDSVRFVAPFPEGTKDKQRSFTINFNLKAKRLLG